MIHARTFASRLTSGLVRRGNARPGRATRGQSLVEFTLLLPLLLALAIGLLEFGMLFKDHLGINYASRAGARVGVAASIRPDADCSILRAISSTLANMEPANLVRVHIYRANGPDNSCTVPCAENVYYRPLPWPTQPECLANNSPGGGWLPLIAPGYPPASRQNIEDRNRTLSPDGLGIEVQYRHDFFFNYIPGANTTSVVVRDATVMQIEPPEFRPVP